MNNTIKIDFEKFRELHYAIHDQWIPNWLEKHYKCSIANAPRLEHNSVGLLFENEQDLIWFKLKYL